ncbi:MAG: hypothetical protein KA248_04735 [Kiritimatiellae bacterium]|nr:hypothetical protein [Kiritimatiellia bacterium]
MKTCMVAALVSLGCLAAAAEDLAVRDADELAAALARAESGDRVLVSRGQYAGNFTVSPGVSLLGEPEFMPGGGIMPELSPWGDTPIVVALTDAGEKHPTQVRGLFFTGAKRSAVEVRGDGVGYVCHNMFEQNRGPRGGAIYSEADGTIYIQTNYFSSNTAETDGGAVYIGGTAGVSLRMNEFLRNGAGASGGGFAVRGTNLVASDRDFFMDNTAAQDGGGVSVVLNPKQVILNRASLFDGRAGRDGGAVSADRATVIILYGSSSGHRAGRHGGFLSVIGGAAGVGSHSGHSATAAECGGGVYSEASTLSCQGSEWMSCAARFGGGMAIRTMPAAGTPPLVQRNTFKQNRAVKDGGALYLADLKEARVENNVLFMNTAGIGDGMVLEPDATALVDHNTIAHIEYRSGQPLPVAEAIRVRGAGNTTRVVNNIIAGHARGVIGDAGGRVQVLGNDFWLTLLPWRDVPNPAGLLNRQGINPVFVQFDPRRMIGDLHLQPNSPCRNAGVLPVLTTVDRDGRRRDAQPDRGAYELPAL